MTNSLKDGNYFFIDEFNLIWSVNIKNNEVKTNFNENYQITKNTYSKSGMTISWLERNSKNDGSGFIIDEFTLFNVNDIPDSVFD